MINETNRSIRTKRLFSQSLMKLLKEKPFEEIKVIDICEDALLHRTTFYTHFEDKYELMDWTIRDRNQELENKLQQSQYHGDYYDLFIEAISIMIDHLDENRNFYLQVLMNNNNSIIIEMILDFSKKQIRSLLLDVHEGILLKVPIDVVTDFYLGGVTNVLRNWLHLGMNENKELVKQYISYLIPKDITK